MKKYLIASALLLLATLLILDFRILSLGVGATPSRSGPTKEITIHILKRSWTYDPESIDVQKGDMLHFTLINDDIVDHGFAIDAFRVSKRIPAEKTIDIAPFVVDQIGDFQYYCSIVCAEGDAESGIHKGEKRGHFDQIGILHVH